MNIEAIARACHEMNMLYCSLLGDHSQKKWHDAPDWQKNSAIKGVQNIIDGVVETPEQSHEQWCRSKVEDGWVHGAVKDPEEKTHPCMVPYEKLPEAMKAKDAIFFAVVAGLRGDL